MSENVKVIDKNVTVSFENEYGTYRISICDDGLEINKAPPETIHQTSRLEITPVVSNVILIK